MLDLIPSCFRDGAATALVAPSQTTSVYETHLGVASLTWSRTPVGGLSILADLRLSTAVEAAAVEEEEEVEHLRFRIRPSIFRKRRGSKRLCCHHREIEFVWDLTRAKFPSASSPEPVQGFFLAVAVDGEMLLVAGDLENEAYRATNARKPKIPLIPALISRRERVKLGEKEGKRFYATTARYEGKAREISIDLQETEEEFRLWLGVDGKRVLDVTRLRWKFRGSERVELEGGDRIQISWDLHNWIFRAKAESDSELGHAVFVFRFEREEEEEGHVGKSGDCGKEKGGYSRNGGGVLGMAEGYLGKKKNWSESSSGSSSSSSLDSSSVGGSTVTEWESPEEAELRSSEGFSLLVYAWKN